MKELERNLSIKNIRDFGKFVDMCLSAEIEDRKAHIWTIDEKGSKLNCAITDRFSNSEIYIDCHPYNDDKTYPMCFSRHILYPEPEYDENGEYKRNPDKLEYSWELRPTVPIVAGYKSISAACRGTISMENGFESNIVKYKFEKRIPGGAAGFAFRTVPIIVPFDGSKSETETDKVADELFNAFTITAKLLCGYLNDIIIKHANDDRCAVPHYDDYEPVNVEHYLDEINPV